MSSVLTFVSDDFFNTKEILLPESDRKQIGKKSVRESCKIKNYLLIKKYRQALNIDYQTQQTYKALSGENGYSTFREFPDVVRHVHDRLKILIPDIPLSHRHTLNKLKKTVKLRKFIFHSQYLKIHFMSLCTMQTPYQNQLYYLFHKNTSVAIAEFAPPAYSGFHPIPYKPGMLFSLLFPG
jgi:hypothetical protein